MANVNSYVPIPEPGVEIQLSMDEAKRLCSVLFVIERATEHSLYKKLRILIEKNDPKFDFNHFQRNEDNFALDITRGDHFNGEFRGKFVHIADESYKDK